MSEFTDRRATKIRRSFYERPTLEVASEMLGKYLVFVSRAGRLAARIVEVEAYVGRDDPACHAVRGQTPRNAPMFGPGGYTYVYFVYGMYHCLNVVTEPEGVPAALLIRAAEPCEGLPIMRHKSSRAKTDQRLLAGPGRLCRSFGLTTEHTNLDLCGNEIFIEDRYEPAPTVACSSRIGIRVGSDRPWRFFDPHSRCVSSASPSARTRRRK